MLFSGDAIFWAKVYIKTGSLWMSVKQPQINKNIAINRFRENFGNHVEKYKLFVSICFPCRRTLELKQMKSMVQSYQTLKILSSQ